MTLKRRKVLWGLLASVTGASIITRVSSASSSASPIIEVSTPEDFFRAIGSNRTIRLTAPQYNLSSLNPQLEWTHAAMSQVFDGYELIVKNVENLTITSATNQRSLVSSEFRYAAVLKFDNCRNITINNVESGHWPKKGYCRGSVIYTSNCQNVQIDKSVLFGSGTYGIEAYNSDRIVINDSVIKECTYGIVSLNGMKNFTANRCQFHSNVDVFTLTYIQGSPGPIAFKDCVFDRNICKGYEPSLFEVENSQPIVLENCLLRNNVADKFSKFADTVQLVNTKMENNQLKE
ncbi:MAG TPA: right-handed parallel beta-helix repeat-containing protein [Leptolyngbyaceae cyanobacterium]